MNPSGRQMEQEYFHDKDDDRDHFQSVIASFKNYRTYTMVRINKRCRYVSSLPDVHQKRLEKYSEFLARFRACVEVNERILDLVVREPETLFQNVPPPSPRQGVSVFSEQSASALDLQVDRVQSVLRQFVRDWSHEGAEERQQCYQPIIDEIASQFPSYKYEPHCVSVLVPGAGLGRLAWEIARRGYDCQGNDVSMYMLLASNFIINHAKQNSYKLHPWLNDFNNNMTCEDQLASVTVPDIAPISEPLPKFSMVAGDFLEVYKEPDWSCVATCFFIDCAQNVIDFVEKIFAILQPGGVWINLGPLLYHWSYDIDKDSIEPPFDMLMDIIRDVGFIVEKEETGIRTKYAQNPNSMLQREYNSVYFVCRKPAGYINSPTNA